MGHWDTDSSCLVLHSKSYTLNTHTSSNSGHRDGMPCMVIRKLQFASWKLEIFQGCLDKEKGWDIGTQIQAV